MGLSTSSRDSPSCRGPMRPIHVVPFAILLLTSACQDDDQNPAAPTPEVAAAAAAPAWRQVAAGELHTCDVTIV